MTMICPVCLEEKSEFDSHHVIWKVENGSDDPVNLLDVCRTCHAIITSGATDDRVPRNMACFSYQIARHGLAFLLNSGLAEDDDWAKLLAKYTEGENKLDARLKECGAKLYYGYISVIKNETTLDEMWRDVIASP